MLDGGDGFQATVAEAGTLKDAVNTAVDKIAGDAKTAASTTVKGLTGIPSADLIKGLGDGVEKVFKQLGEKVNWLKRKALAFVLKAIQKLLAVFGTNTEAIRKKIEDWVGDLDEDKVSGLLQRLYGVDTLKEGYGSRIDSESQAVSRRTGIRPRATSSLRYRPSGIPGPRSSGQSAGSRPTHLSGLADLRRRWVYSLTQRHSPWRNRLRRIRRRRLPGLARGRRSTRPSRRRGRDRRPRRQRSSDWVAAIWRCSAPCWARCSPGSKRPSESSSSARGECRDDGRGVGDHTGSGGAAR